MTESANKRRLADPAGDTRDDRGSAWSRFVEDIDCLLATGHYTWAAETLRAIQTTVTQQQTVTPGQRQAVARIETELTPRRNWRRLVR